MAPARKLNGRAFYESIGSPKYVVAPMVDQSEFAWRMLTRSFLPSHLRTSVLAYSPMLHAKLFAEAPKYRASHFEPLKIPLVTPQTVDGEHDNGSYEDSIYLDGNPEIDRPLFVQFCANEPDQLLEAARIVQPYCDAVDLNLGCPQGIARRGHYGAFLQEDWETIYKLINTLHENLDIPVTAKMRILDTKEKTLEYAKMILSAGASIITVHGRLREQKGHNTGLADWAVLRYLREQLPQDTVIFANGNILQHADLQQCLDETRADGVMSAEGNLYDPSIFAPGPPAGEEGREYWRGRDGKGGYRVDAVLRRYLDVIHEHVLGQAPPLRNPLPLPSDAPAPENETAPESRKRAHDAANGTDDQDRPSSKKQKTSSSKKPGKPEKCTNPNLTAMQAHCFHILRSFVASHHDVRDALAHCRAGDLDAYEHVLSLTETAVLEGLRAYEQDPSQFEERPESLQQQAAPSNPPAENVSPDPTVSSLAAVRRCKRPFWVCQPYVRPLPAEAIAKGSMQPSKKEKARLAAATQQAARHKKETVGGSADGAVEVVATTTSGASSNGDGKVEESRTEIPKEGMVCG